jgi:hypothetical protein
MNLKCLVFSLFFFYCSCASTKKGQDIKPGETDPSQIQNNFKWFQNGYKAYHPDISSIRKLKESLPSYRIIIFAGIWCTDTQRLLPEFYKTIDEAGYSRDNTTLYLVDHKIHSPEKLEDTYHVKSIPAFIILKDEKEIARIVENPKTTIEDDLAKIVK